MRYDLYFHDDFDGRASAAVMLAFLRSRGDTVERYIPLDLGIKPRWGSVKFKNPAIVLDFPYHPKATFWFDHHLTTFTKLEWGKQFNASKFHIWNPRYPSCCSLVFDSLIRNFGFKPPRHLKELAHALDMVDGANFKSAKQTIEIKEPAIQLEHYVAAKGNPTRPLEWFVRLMSTTPLRKIVRDPRIRRFMRKIYKKRGETLKYYTAHLQIYDRVAFLDLTKRIRLLDLRFIPYYLDPRLLYFVFTKRHRKEYGIHVGTNPWRKAESRVHLGKLMQRYGGGGHRYVGAARMARKKEAEKIAKELIAFLNTERR